MDLQFAFNLVSGALLSLALFNLRQLYARVDRLEAIGVECAKDVARLDAEHSSVLDRLDRIENKLDRLLEREGQ